MKDNGSFIVCNPDDTPHHCAHEYRDKIRKAIIASIK